jgi:hypothetical protein
MFSPVAYVSSQQILQNTPQNQNGRTVAPLPAPETNNNYRYLSAVRLFTFLAILVGILGVALSNDNITKTVGSILILLALGTFFLSIYKKGNLLRLDASNPAPATLNNINPA